MNQSAPSFAAVLDHVRGAGLFSSVCNIHETSQETDDLGQVDLSTLTPREGLQDIPCMSAPPNQRDAGFAYERMTPEQFAAYSLKHCILDGLYEDIRVRDVAEVDGQHFAILNVESDSQRTYTRLALKDFEL